MSECQIFKTEYARLEKLQKDFELELEQAVRSGDTEKIKKLKVEIEEKLQNLEKKLIPKEIKASFTNPETNEQKEIIFNIPEIIKSQQEFYKKFNLNFNKQEIRQIINKHKAEIQKEVEAYGYDQILILPENLPTSEELNQILIESIPNTNPDGTWQSDNFKNGGGFQGVENAESRKTKIILTHSDQNIYGNEKANPFLKATLGKNISMLVLDISPTEWAAMPDNEREIKNQEALQKIKQGAEINLRIKINNQTKKIQAEGLSLNEYLILQRQYFEKNNQHLDEKGWTWLLKSCSAARVVDARWNPGVLRLNMAADDLGISDVSLGCRLSRSFELT